MAIDTRAVRAVTTGHAGIPPLSQSRFGDMACDSLYFHKHVQGFRAADSEAAARGIEIHRILATYLDHLAATKHGTDLEALDTLIKGTGDEARSVLEKFRENHVIDPQKILGTELHIALDKNFRPIENLRGEAKPAEYEGTLDLVMLDSFTDAEIHDWKSYYQIIAPDTFQSKFYPLLLMCLNPTLERVKFVLEFVRYGVSRSVEYTRKDLPWLKELAQRERARQIKLHEIDLVGEHELKASPGRHCTWCPLLLKGCPVAETNPYGQMTAEGCLRFALWLQEAEEQNSRVLKELLVEMGLIRYRDGNGSSYLAEFVPTQKKFYPYHDAVSILDEWFGTHPDEKNLRDKLTISGLSSALKAEKRSELAQKLTSVVDVRVETELRIGREGKNGEKEKG
ncbi:MAG TPA: PD-(D/E)XK nuclease family protein [Blastocatellia bacterium]|nr:PD-(D/E)XK nuclease family protein [Blastocatellia bacterium]